LLRISRSRAGWKLAPRCSLAHPRESMSRTGPAAIVRVRAVWRDPAIVSCSAAMRAVCATAANAASGNAKVLITGESGVGKDLIAQYIHARSPRAAQSFVAVNCAAFAESLLESEL